MTHHPDKNPNIRGGGKRVIPLKGDESGVIGVEINEAGLPEPRNLFILFYIFLIRGVAGSKVKDTML